MDNADTQDATPTNVNVNRVALRPPPFWKGDPAVWFAQIEAQFALSGITNDTTKYNHVLSAVDTEVLTPVTDIIQAPPESNKYATLKTRLIETFTDSSEKKLRKLLGDIELGDRKPSVLLHEMQRLGGMALSAQMLKTWLQHLPVTTQACLAVSKGELDELPNLQTKCQKLINIVQQLQW